ncbi:phenylalanine--tRNA ligase subunit beta [Candidatus Pacearchaeota archaeon RBG_19FT_COMBO_34_9]|nr:MAG: phenylalanine--tRNA ligase subunit beta [Candidatus Pacearchaeota archaeon RBG_19FT_COMBO_34_9]OGJ16982.1 MAG: phenylalanine--tRNA ligase subunit beta [Candidatus Pacearchaeota archaeon RBG_13_33_26]
MANVTFPRKQFEKEIGRLDEKMQNKIAMFGTPLEKFNDEEIEIEVFPNRPDLLSYHGFKRAFLAFLGKQKGMKEYKLNKPEKDYIVYIDSSVKNIRPYTACAIVRNLKFDDDKIKEIIDIQEKLHLTVGRKRKKLAIGIYPLEKIKLPITFRALEPDRIKFIPLESEKEMSGLQILQRHATGREYAHLLAGKPKFPIFIDSKGNILSMPPIINSHLTGKITSDTHDVFVECSGFDFDILKKCLNIIVTNLADMGGEIYQMELHYKKKEITPDLSKEKMKLNLNKANSLLGLKLNEKQIKELIERMGYNYNRGNAEIPSWRTDILHEVDLIEDIAIAYGYENFVPEIPEISTTGKENKKETIKRKMAEILSGLNMLEISNYHLTNKTDQFKKMILPEENFTEVESSKTDYTLLRKDLTHYLLKILSENVDAEYPQRIFEIGKVFSNTDEQENLALAITPANFTEVRQVLEYLFRTLSIEIKIAEPKDKIPNYFVDGRTVEINLFEDNKNNSAGVGERFRGGKDSDKQAGSRVGEKVIGFLGEIHPKILKNWKIKMPVALLEINLEEVFRKLG